MSGKGSAALLFGLVGTVAVGVVTALSFGKGTEEETKKVPTKRKRSPQTFESIEPRGLHWWSVSQDYKDVDLLPKLILEEPQRLAGYRNELNPSDPFAGHENFVQILVASGKCAPSSLEQILRDLPRTFPDEDYFKDTDVQDTLRRVLMAVCVEYPDIGYVQSQNFLAGFLFLHTKTEDGCFALFRRLMSHPRLRMEDMYKKGLPLLFKVLHALEKLTERHAPLCHQKFKEVELEYIMFAQTWMMTLFTFSLPWDICGPVWDKFFETGWESPLRVALFLIRSNSQDIVNGDFDSISAVLREACANAPKDIAFRSFALAFDQFDRDIVNSVLM